MLLALAAAPEARASYCGYPTAQDWEIGFGILDDSVFRVTVTNERTNATDTRIADPANPLPFSDCSWIAHVGEAATNPDRVHMDANTRYTMAFERLDGGGQTVETLTYTYSLCRNPVDGTSPPADPGNFYCPYGTASGFPDLLLLWTGTAMKVVPYAWFSVTPDPYANQSASAGILPYDHVNYTKTNPNGTLEDLPFFTRQDGPSYCISTLTQPWSVPDDSHWEAADDVTSLALFGDLTVRDLQIEGVGLTVGGQVQCNDDDPPPPSGSGGATTPSSPIEVTVASGNALTLRDLDVENEGRGLTFTGPTSTLALDGVTFTDTGAGSFGFYTTTFTLQGNVAFETGDFNVDSEPQLATGTHLTVGTGATVQHWPDLVVPTGATLEAESGATMRFRIDGSGDAYGLVVDGTLTASGATFTGFNTTHGWAGIHFGAGATGTLTNTIVEYFGNTFPDPDRQVPLYGVNVYDADVTLAGSTVREGINAFGVGVSGTAGQVTVDKSGQTESLVERNDSGGIFVGPGARLHLFESRVLDNSGPGVRVVGTGARAYVFAAEVSNNDGIGFEASSGGYAAFDRPTGGDPMAQTWIQFNLGGGLSAEAGATLYAGTYKDAVGACYTTWNNRIEGHAFGGSAPFDARSLGGSTLRAQCDYWGPVAGPYDTSSLTLLDDGSSILKVTPLLTSPPALRQDGAPFAAAARGAGVEGSGTEGGDGTHALVAEALQAEAEEDWTAAFALYESALFAATDDDTRRLAFSATARLLGMPETPTPPPGLLAALDAFASVPERPERPWALRAFVAAGGAGGDVAQARTTAALLVAAYAGSEHARYGLAAEVALALVAGDPEAAVAALATLVTEWPEAPETAAAWALAAAALGEEALPAPGLRGTEAAASAAAVEEPAGLALGEAYPNPSRGGAVVPFALSSPAHVRLAVYDAIGREVAVLAEGRYGTGRHEALLDGGALPSGTYLVRATVEPEGEAPRTLTQRLTLLK